MKKKYIIFMTFILMILCSNLSYGYINIYPTKFEKDITHGVQEKFYLYNRTNKTVKYRIYVEKAEKNNMSEWIEVYPRSITLKPLEEKEIRISVIPPKSAEAGTYKAKLVVKEVDMPGAKRKEKVKFMTLLKLNLTGYVGDKNYDEKNS